MLALDTTLLFINNMMEYNQYWYIHNSSKCTYMFCVTLKWALYYTYRLMG